MSRRRRRDEMGTFLPWSERSKKWEPEALKLRRLATPQTEDVLKFNPWKLAPEVGLHVVECEFPGLTNEERNHMTGGPNYRWSGGVYVHPLPNGRRICILNPNHPHRRNKITLMEEICHCFLKHSPSKLIVNGNATYRDFNETFEAEAYGVGAAVLLPWRLFFPLLNGGCTKEELADEFDVTPDLVMYRTKICGASALYASRQRKRA